MIDEKEVVKSSVNRSFVFIAPLVDINKKFNNIINTYLGDVTRENLYQHLYVNNRYEDLKLARSRYCIDSYKLPNSTYMYIYEIPPQFQDDYNLILQGKYSEISDKAKKKLCEVTASGYNVRPEKTVIYGVLYKTEARRKELEDKIGMKLPNDAELASIIDFEKELYDGIRI